MALCVQFKVGLFNYEPMTGQMFMDIFTKLIFVWKYPSYLHRTVARKPLIQEPFNYRQMV